MNGYVLHMSHWSLVNFVSSNEKKYTFVCFYMDKFDGNSYRGDEKRTCNSGTPNMKTELHFRSRSLHFHCVKSAQIRSFLWSVFSCIRTEYGDLLRKSPYSVRILENTDQKKNPYLDTFHAVFILLQRPT